MSKSWPKKPTIIGCAFVAVILCGTLIFVFRAHKHTDIYEFYSSFIPENILYYNDKGDVCCRWVSTAPEKSQLLKYADILNIDPNYKVDICIISLQGRALKYEITNLCPEDQSGFGGKTLLLKHMNGAWYIIPQYTRYNPFDTIKSLETISEWSGMAVFIKKYNDTGTPTWYCGNIPSGKYALFSTQDIIANEIDGKIVATGGGLIEFELVQNEKLGVYVEYGGYFDFIYAGNCELKSIGQTLYQDPYI